MTVPDYVRLARHELDLDDDGHDTTGGGSALTVSDEGTPLATDATSLDFTGAGVTASGTGAAKTITIPGGGVADILDLPTAETDAGLVLAPDGVGGVAFRAETGGSGLPWFDVTVYGAVHDGATDDTAAIQAALDACTAAGGGTVFFPNGIYAIKGALQDTSTYNSQLEIPQNPLTGGLTQPPISIRLLGMGPVAQSNNGASGAWLPSLSGAILLSDWAGTITGDPAVIAAGKVDAEYPAASFNWVQVSFENIEVRTPANPKLSAIQMRAAIMLHCRDVTVSTDTASAGMALPSNANAIGIDMPFGINSNPPDTLENVFVDGYYTGIRTSEQTNGVGSVQVSHCTRGIQFTGGMGAPTYIRHANVFDKILSVACPRVLVFDGDQRWVYIALLNVEQEAGTFATVYDIDDASNYARGFVGWHTTDYSSGPGDNLVVNGATGLSLHGAYAKRWKLNNVVDIPVGTNPSTNPANGRRLYTDSSTGHLSARDSAGAVIDYEAGSGGAPTTADYLVGTSQAGLSAEIVVGTTPGGELGGTWASPTVDGTHAGSTHLALGSTSSTAAAGDHTHPATGGGELLVGDGASGAFGVLPSSYVEMATPRTTTSSSLADITGVTTTITIDRTSDVAVWMNCEVSASGGAADLALAININGADHDEVTTHMAAAGTDNGVSGIVHRTSVPLPAGTYTVKGRFRRPSGSGTPAVDRADLLVMATGMGGPIILTNEAGDDFLYAD